MLTWALCGGEWLTPYRWENTSWYSLNRRQGGSEKDGLDVLQEKNKFWPLSVFEVRIAQLLA